MVTEKNKYIKWIDLAKGFGIVMVLVGHINFLPVIIKNYIYSFHMPYFMILSGIVFSYKSSFDKFISKKIKTLIIPYIFFTFVLFLFFSLKKIYYGNRGFLTSFINLFTLKEVYAPWYLICLFFVTIIYYFVVKLINNNKIIIIITTILMLFFGIYYFTKIKIQLPLQFQYVFTMIVFFSIGYIIKVYNLSNKIFKIRYVIIFFVLSVFFYYLKMKYSIPYTSITSNIYGNFLIFYPLAIFSSFYIIGICIKINSIPILDYIGKNSIVYFSMQQATVLFPIMLIVEHFFGSKIYMNFNFFVSCIITFVLLLVNIIVLTIENIILSKTKLKVLIGK